MSDAVTAAFPLDFEANGVDFQRKLQLFHAKGRKVRISDLFLSSRALTSTMWYGISAFSRFPGRISVLD